MSPTAFIRNLGCPKNEVDGGIMAAYLERAGCVLVSSPARADLIIVNTCGFIRDAKEESLREIFELARYKDSNRPRTLVVAGCLAQRYKDELSEGIPEIDCFLGIGDLKNIENIVGPENGGRTFTGKLTRRYQVPEVYPQCRPRSFAYLKISDGCSNRCSYCAIPQIRGCHRSRPMVDIVGEARHHITRGARELVLIAQDTTDYGRDLYGRQALPELVSRLSALDGRFSIRIMYAHPKGLTSEIRTMLASGGRILPYLDMPLQHISDRILSAMNRRVTSKRILDLITRLRESVPGIVLRTTYLIGFPGETTSDFEKLLHFQEEFDIERVGVFGYSPEERTKALGAGSNVREGTIARRVDTLMNLVQEQSLRRNHSLVGSVQELLVDGPAGRGTVWSRLPSQAPEVDGSVLLRGRFRRGTMLKARITAAEAYDLKAEAA
jgi:ribosomal protein S12 methylthiotransferase